MIQGMQVILVTGSQGQLGSELKELSASYPSYKFVFLSRKEAPIGNNLALIELFEKYRPVYFINCAAYTAVDKAEAEKEDAFTINGKAVGELATLCRQYQTKLIHISTDYVFDGNATSPLKESDKTDPVNQYGASKLLGEQLALRNNPDVLIIRTSWVYSFYGKNFVKTMMKLMSERSSLNVVGDQKGSPTYAADLAEAIMQIISSNKWVPGIYHYSNEGNISWYDFALAIKEVTASTCQINSIATSQFPTPAKRPAYSVMDKEKIRAAYNLQLKPWKESLKKCVSRLNSYKLN